MFHYVSFILSGCFLSDLLTSKGKFLFILSTVVGTQKLNMNPPIVFLAVIFRESTDV